MSLVALAEDGVLGKTVVDPSVNVCSSLWRDTLLSSQRSGLVKLIEVLSPRKAARKPAKHHKTSFSLSCIVH